MPERFARAIQEREAFNQELQGLEFKPTFSLLLILGMDRKGWKPEDLARESKFSSSLVSRVLNEPMPRCKPQTIIKLAESLDIDRKTLLNLAGRKPKPEDLDIELEFRINMLKSLHNRTRWFRVLRSIVKYDLAKHPASSMSTSDANLTR